MGYRRQVYTFDDLSIHQDPWSAFIIVSGCLFFTTMPFMNLVKAQIIQSIYLSPILFKSKDTTELKSVARDIATDGLDFDREFFLQISHFSMTSSISCLMSL